MSVTFHVFTKGDFSESISNKDINPTISDYINSHHKDSTPRYGLRRGSISPLLDGWYLMRKDFPRIMDNDVPAIYRTLALMMDL